MEELFKSHNVEDEVDQKTEQEPWADTAECQIWAY